MVAAGCGSYGDGRQWQEDSRGFSYLVASHSPPLQTANPSSPAVAVLCMMLTAEAGRLPEMPLQVPETTGLHGSTAASGEWGRTAGGVGGVLLYEPQTWQAESEGAFSKKPLPG